MKNLILKWLGINEMNDRICKLESFKYISELESKKIGHIETKLDFVYKNIKFDPYSVFEKYKYYEFKKIPNFVLDLFVNSFAIQFKDIGADTAIYCDDKFVGYTQMFFGEIMESINRRRQKQE